MTDSFNIIDIFLSAFFYVFIDSFVDILLFIFGTGLAAVGVLFTIRQYRLSQRQAAHGPKISLDLYGSKTTEHLYVLLPFAKDKIIKFPFVMGINNKGDHTALDVELGIEVSEQLYRPDGTERTLPSIAKAKKIEFAFDPVSGTKKLMVYYNIGNINPHSGVAIGDLFITDRETYFERHVKTMTSDRANVVIGINGFAVFEVIISITARDYKSMQFKFFLHFRNSPDSNVEKFLHREVDLRGRDFSRNLTEKFKTGLYQEILNKVQSYGKSHGMSFVLSTKELPDTFLCVVFNRFDEEIFKRGDYGLDKDITFVTAHDPMAQIISNNPLDIIELEKRDD